MGKPNFIELPFCEPIPILYEDRAVLAIDKPRGWLLVPVNWQNTNRNLQAAINSSISAGDYWARARNLKFLRYVHRLDTDTSGVMLFAKSMGAVEAFGDVFESRQMEKHYLAIVVGVPREKEWTCRLPLAPDPRQIGRMIVDTREGKECETRFRLLQQKERISLVEAHPLTGRTHQIRVHLAQSGCPIVSDELYGKVDSRMQLGLRAIKLAYVDPFTRRRVEICAPIEGFMSEYGFTPSLAQQAKIPAASMPTPAGITLAPGGQAQLPKGQTHGRSPKISTPPPARDPVAKKKII
jgi:23S rRNA pseudouridine1911/1915/1917 synthase